MYYRVNRNRVLQRESTISNLETVSLVGTWGKRLPKMEEVLIMGLVVPQLVIFV